MKNSLNELQYFKKNLEKKIKSSTRTVEDWTFAGFLGDDDGVIHVPDLPNYVYVRGFDAIIHKVFNPSFNLPWNAPVIFGFTKFDTHNLRLLSANEIYTDPQTPYLLEHGKEHSYGGSDVSPIWMEQFMFWKVIAQDAMTIRIHRAPFRTVSGAWVEPDIEDIDLSAYVPTAGARWAYVEVLKTGVLNIVLGSIIGNRYGLDLSNLPDGTAGAFALAAIVLYYTQESIQMPESDTDETDIVDLRFGNIVNNDHNSGIADGGIYDIQFANEDGNLWSSDNFKYVPEDGKLLFGTQITFSSSGGIYDQDVLSLDDDRVRAYLPVEIPATSEPVTPDVGFMPLWEDETTKHPMAKNSDGDVFDMSMGAIDDAIVDGITNRAPSQNSVYDALALKVSGGGSGVAGQIAEWLSSTTLRAAKIVGPTSNILTILNGAASTLNLQISSGKALKFVAADDYDVTFLGNITFPAIGSTGDLLVGSSSSAFTRIPGVAAGKPLVSGGLTTAPLYAPYTFAGTSGKTYTFPVLDATLPGLALANIFTAIQKINVNSASAFIVDQPGVFDNVFNVDTAANHVSAGSHGAVAQVGILQLNNSSSNTALAGRAGELVIRNVDATANAYNLIQFNSPTGTIAAGIAAINTTPASHFARIDIQTRGTSGYLVALSAFDGRVGIGATSPTSKLQISGTADIPVLLMTGFTTQAVGTAIAQIVRNDVAAGVSSMLSLTALGSGVVGDGGSINFFGKDSTTTAMPMGFIDWRYTVATHASYTTALRFYARDSGGARLGLEIEGSGTAAKLAFFGGTTVIRGAALTTQLTSITHTAPGTPDYAIQDFVDVSLAAGWAFANHDEANTFLSVVKNLQIRLAELEARLGSATGVNLFA